MNKSINLLGNKNHVSAPPASRKLKLMRAIAVLLLFGVSAAAVIISILIAFSPLPQVQQQEQASRQTLSQYHPEMAKIALIQDRLIGISAILSQRNKYADFLTSVNNKIPPGVSLYQISINKKNATLTVRSNSLDLLDRFLNNLVMSANNKEEYSRVTLNSITSDDQSNLFSLTVSLALL